MREQIGAFIGAQVASHRKRERLSQAQLGERVGVSRQAVAQWESGNLPAIDTLYLIATEFEIEVFDLLPTIRQVR